MKKTVTAKAYSNIALAKYWGKAGPGNAPATPSISLTLDKLYTITSVTPGLKADTVRFDGKTASKDNATRILSYLDCWRRQKLIDGFFEINTKNSFPAAVGLASSASGFAALAKALSAFSARKLSISSLARLARMGSGSAARSITGGLSALPAGNDPAARLLSGPQDVPWGMAVAICSTEPKPMPSGQGMEHCRRTSPYYQAWISQASRDYKQILRAIKEWDLKAVGEAVEANMLAMHACMASARPPLLYWNPTTVALLHSTSQWRKRGLNVYATIDAGPNVALLAPLDQCRRISNLAAKIPGVLEVIASKPGGSAHFVSP